MKFTNKKILTLLLLSLVLVSCKSKKEKVEDKPKITETKKEKEKEDNTTVDTIIKEEKLPEDEQLKNVFKKMDLIDIRHLKGMEEIKEILKKDLKENELNILMLSGVKIEPNSYSVNPVYTTQEVKKGEKVTFEVKEGETYNISINRGGDAPKKIILSIEDKGIVLNETDSNKFLNSNIKGLESVILYKYNFEKEK